MNDDKRRYATCMKCGYLMDWESNNLLVANVPCADCGLPDQFGPDVYVEDFNGYTAKEAIRQRAEKAGRA